MERSYGSFRTNYTRILLYCSLIRMSKNNAILQVTRSLRVIIIVCHSDARLLQIRYLNMLMLHFIIAIFYVLLPSGFDGSRRVLSSTGQTRQFQDESEISPLQIIYI